MYHDLIVSLSKLTPQKRFAALQLPEVVRARQEIQTFIDRQGVQNSTRMPPSLRAMHRDRAFDLAVDGGPEAQAELSRWLSRGGSSEEFGPPAEPTDREISAVERAVAAVKEF